MMAQEPPVSHADLYHKLGKLEGLMETMMASVSAFQSAIRDVHSRIDSIEQRQNILENQQSSNRGSTNALTSAAKDFAVPLIAIVATWLVTTASQRQQPAEAVRPFPTPPRTEHAPGGGHKQEAPEGPVIHR